MNDHFPLLSIVTPVYNRAALIQKCWESLTRQTDKDFEWIVVHDGSTDGSADAVKALPDAGFPVTLVEKENGGKHTALNAAHPYVHGKYVLILDSDDRLIPSAVEQILMAWKEYEDYEEVGQVIFLKGYTETEPICYVKHERMIVDTLKEPRIGVAGRDCCESFRTELFVKHPFPEFPGERFLGEGASFFFIELEAKGVYINQVIYLCNYLEDGLTKAGRKMRLLNPLGGRFNSLIYMHHRLPIKTRLKKAILYVCYSRFAKIPLKRIIGENPYKLLTCAALIPSTALYYSSKQRYFSYV